MGEVRKAGRPSPRGARSESASRARGSGRGAVSTYTSEPVIAFVTIATPSNSRGELRTGGWRKWAAVLALFENVTVCYIAASEAGAPAAQCYEKQPSREQMSLGRPSYIGSYMAGYRNSQTCYTVTRESSRNVATPFCLA